MEGFVPRDNVTRPHSTPVKKKCHRPTAKLRYVYRVSSDSTAKKIKKCQKIPRDSVTRAQSKKIYDQKRPHILSQLKCTDRKQLPII